MPTSVKLGDEPANCGFLLVPVDAFRCAAADVCIGQEVPNVLWKLNTQTPDMTLKLLRLGEPQLKVIL